MGNVRILCFAGLLASASTIALAEQYDFEVGVGYMQSSVDSVDILTLNPPVVPAPIEVTSTRTSDSDDVAVFGAWYFSGLSDDTGPRARAAFVDRASFISFSYRRMDQEFASAYEDENGMPVDPVFPDFSGYNTVDEYALNLRWIHRESGWYGIASVARADFDSRVDLDPERFEEDATSYSIGVGKYLFTNTAIEVEYRESEVDDFSANETTIRLSHLGSLGSSWQYALDLGYTSPDSDFDLDFDEFFVGFNVYPTPAIELGLVYEYQAFSDSDFDASTYGVIGSWYFTQSAAVSMSYSVVDQYAPSGFPVTFSDQDQDSWGIGFSLRF